MFNGINSANSTLLSLNQNGKSLQESIDTMFNQLNPVNLKQDADITGPLKRLSESGAYIRDKYVKGITDKLSVVFCPDQQYHKNDIKMFRELIDITCGPKHLKLKDAIKELTFNAIKEVLQDFKNFIIADPNSAQESVNFNRMLPMVGFASTMYGYFGKKIILEGVKEILEGSKKDERYGKFEKVIFDQKPGNEAVSKQNSDYFMGYCMAYGDELDEPYDKERLAILNRP